MILDETVDIKGFECNIINSRKINIKAKLEVAVKVYSNENVEIISRLEEISDIQALNNEIEINSLVGEGNTKTYAKDTIAIDVADDLGEILQTKFRIVNKETKVSYNKVLVKADCDIAIMYLTEDNRKNVINTKLPIIGFVDIPNINDDNTCDVKYKLRNIIVKPNNQEQHSIYIEAEVEVICFAYETKYINVIEDVYSTSANLNFTKKQIRTISDKNQIKDIYNIKEQIVIPEMGENKLYDVAVEPNITNMRIQKGRAIFEGEVGLKFLFEVNNGIGTKDTVIPFNFEVGEEAINEDMIIESNIEIERENFIVSSGSVEAEINLEFNLNVLKERNIDIIEEIAIEPMEKSNIYSMTVYFVKPGDTVWKIAKRLKSTIEDIQRINEIDDINKIYMGQQLYIPKYVRKNVTI